MPNTNLPRKADQVIAAAVRNSSEQYIQFVREVLSGATGEASQEWQRIVARAIVLADIFGRSSAWTNLRRSGIVLPNVTRDMPAEVGMIRFEDAATVFRTPFTHIAASLSDLVPRIASKIVEAARRASGIAAQIVAQERVQILERLAPILRRQLAEAGVSQADFFVESEQRLRGTRFSDLTRSRLENVFRTNISSATNEAHWQETHDPQVLQQITMFRYDAVDDRRVRPHHHVFDGFTAPSTWGGWRIIWPPNGYQCRCSPPIPLSLRESNRLGFLDKNGQLVPGRYKKTWQLAISAGLIDDGGHLSYPRRVSLVDRKGRTLNDSFPQEGFD